MESIKVLFEALSAHLRPDWLICCLALVLSH